MEKEGRKRHKTRVVLGVVGDADAHPQESLAAVAERWAVPSSSVYRWVAAYGRPRNPTGVKRAAKKPPIALDDEEAYGRICEALAEGYCRTGKLDIRDVRR